MRSVADQMTDRWLAAVERRGPRSLESRWRQGASRIGVPYEQYRAEIAAGNRWCSGHQAFCPADTFGPHGRTAGGLNTRCREADRENARRSMARLRAQRKAAAS